MNLTSNPSVWQIDGWELAVRLFIALVLGGLIGLERELGDHPAGFRTHILVCLGSALIMLLSIYGFPQFANEPNVRIDPARLAAQVISGIGFLGAGTIMRTGLSVSGLTTAASLWVSAAIGLAVGAGFYYAAMIATGLVLLSLFVLNKLEKNLTRARRVCEISLKMVEAPGNLNEVFSKLSQLGVKISNIEIENISGADNIIQMKLMVKISKPAKFQQMVEEVSLMKNIVGFQSDFYYAQTEKRGARV